MSVPPSERDPALVLEHAPYVRALARALVFDRQLARDLEQEVLLAALENAPRDPRSIKGWLATVVRNLASKAFRSGSRRREREQRAALREDAVPTPEEILAREDLRRWLLEHLLALAEPVRSVMILRFLEELPPRDVARRLSLPVETVRTRIKRGLEELRQRLDREPRKGNGVWCLALVRGLKLEVPSVLGAGLVGVLAVSTSKKAIASVLVLALATTAFLVTRQLEPLHPPAEAAALPGPDTTKLSGQDLPPSVPQGDGRSSLAAEPPAPPTAAAARSSLLLKLSWHDGTPAAGVSARIYSSGAEDFYADAFEVTTGEDGTHLCEDVPPGRIGAYLDRGPVGECKLAAGEQAEIALTIPRGFDLSGTVVERDGRPVAGAEILLDHMGSGWNAMHVGYSQSDGSFRLRSLERGLCWVTAHAALHAPSAQVEVVGGEVDVEGLRVRFDGSGAAVEGVVLDPEGKPLPGAQVLLGREDAFDPSKTEEGRAARVPAAQLARSDEAGRFRFGGAPVGTLPVQARVRGLALWKGEVVTAEGGRAELAIRLQAGVTLRGRASDSAGKPVKAQIEANGDYGFGQRFRRCAADGSFVVTGLPAGEFDVKASADGHESASAKLVAAPGAELAWNPVLGSGLSITGRLVGQGIDFSKWWMYCESDDWQKAPYSESATPKADGSFEFKGCGNALHHIRAHAPGANLFPTAFFDARPGGEPLLVNIDPAMLPSCKLRGRILDENGKPLAGASFSASLVGARFTPLETADAQGRFELGPTPPGEYLISVRMPGYCVLRTERMRLEPGATAEFGDLQLQRAGTIVVHLARPASGAVSIDLWHGGKSVGWIGLEAGRGRSEELEPGEYELRPQRMDQDEGPESARVKVTVRAGEETTVEISPP